MNPKKQSTTTAPAAKGQNIALSGKEKMMLVSNMATMLSAGIPILETVESLLEDAKGSQKKLLMALKQDLAQGQHVSYTFSRFPMMFDKVTINILRASEEAGNLDTTLKDLKDSIKHEMEFNDKIRGAMIYPVFVLVIFVVMMLVILVVVVPKISTIFLSMNVPLPLPTKVMIAMSNALLAYPIPIALAAIVLGIGASFVFKRYKSLFVALFTSMPVVSGLTQAIDLTRFCRSLYLLLSAGIPVTSALELTENSVTKQDVHRAITHVKNTVYAGKSFTEGLKDNKKIFPSIMIRIVEAGERSGSLDKSMLDISDYLDYEVSEKLKTVTALVEPMMLVLIGVLVGGMMVSIIAPMYGLISQVGAH